MTTQIQTTPAIRSTSFFALPLADHALDEPIQASSVDYGFDFDEEELARDLLTPITLDSGNQPALYAEEICAMHFLA